MRDTRTEPATGQKVWILVKNEWLPATFTPSDYFFDGEDEQWWFGYFWLDDGTTVPADIQSDEPLPKWRPREG